MNKIALIIESASDGEIWGRVHYDDDLIVANAKDIEQLKNEMAKQLVAFHDLRKSQIHFEIQYDISGLFDHKKYLNISSVAKLAGINPSLMRQYASGVKNPSTERLKAIQTAVHSIGEELRRIKLAL
jgi:transcriptional regulator with XRE-family HTH domain